jgi:hypothetical protein
MGFFMYLREMRRWFTLAGLALILIGLFSHVRFVAWIGLALIALQLVFTIQKGFKDSRDSRARRDHRDSRA